MVILYIAARRVVMFMLVEWAAGRRAADKP